MSLRLISVLILALPSISQALNDDQIKSIDVFENAYRQSKNLNQLLAHAKDAFEPKDYEFAAEKIKASGVDAKMLPTMNRKAPDTFEFEIESRIVTAKIIERGIYSINGHTLNFNQVPDIAERWKMIAKALPTFAKNDSLFAQILPQAHALAPLALGLLEPLMGLMQGMIDNNRCPDIAKAKSTCMVAVGRFRIDTYNNLDEDEEPEGWFKREIEVKKAGQASDVTLGFCPNDSSETYEALGESDSELLNPQNHIYAPQCQPALRVIQECLTVIKCNMTMCSKTGQKALAGRKIGHLPSYQECASLQPIYHSLPVYPDYFPTQSREPRETPRAPLKSRPPLNRHPGDDLPGRDNGASY